MPSSQIPSLWTSSLSTAHQEENPKNHARTCTVKTSVPGTKGGASNYKLKKTPQLAALAGWSHQQGSWARKDPLPRLRRAHPDTKPLAEVSCYSKRNQVTKGVALTPLDPPLTSRIQWGCSTGRKHFFFLLKLVFCRSSFLCCLTLRSAEAQGMQREAHPGTSWDTWIHLTAKWTKPSLHTAPRALSKRESSFHPRKNKGGKGFPRKQFSFDACHEAVSAPESRHTCGPLWCAAEQCVLLLNLLRASTRQRLKHAEVIQCRGTETLRHAVLSTGAVPDTTFIYSGKVFCPVWPSPASLPNCWAESPSYHGWLTTIWQVDSTSNTGRLFFPFWPMRNISWKLECYLLPDKALYFLCAYGIKQEGKKIPQRKGGKKNLPTRM